MHRPIVSCGGEGALTTEGSRRRRPGAKVMAVFRKVNDDCLQRAGFLSGAASKWLGFSSLPEVQITQRAATYNKAGSQLVKHVNEQNLTMPPPEPDTAQVISEAVFTIA